MNTAEVPILETPNKDDRLLLHSCCAPCEGEVLETLLNSKIQPTVFFYNPNNASTGSLPKIICSGFSNNSFNLTKKVTDSFPSMILWS